MVISDQQDSLHNHVSMRPSNDSTDKVSFSTCIRHDSLSGADDGVNIQSPAVHDGSQTDSVLSQDRDHISSFLSTGSDQSSTVYSSRGFNNTSSTQHVSDITAPDQSDANQLLDLGLKCKGFRMGHMNIQGLSNKMDQVRLLLESDKNQIHVLGLSETKLNDIHPDSVFEINGF